MRQVVIASHSSVLHCSGARWRSAKMLILFVLLLVTHQAVGVLQCPKVATSFRGEVDLSSFSMLLEQPEGVEDGGKVSMSGDDQCKLIARLFTIML